MTKSACLISFSPIYRDARVLRQIKYLAPFYDLTVIGYGPPHPAWQDSPRVRWKTIPETKSSRPSRLASLIRLTILARLEPSWYDRWYWQKPGYRAALAEADASGCAVFHANDWEALPVAAEAARRNKAYLVFDAHEFAPLEFEQSWQWRWLRMPAIRYFLSKYAPLISAATTVAEPIARRYEQEFGLKPIVVFNTPNPGFFSFGQPDPSSIKLIHHGVSNRDRRLEKMIETIALCDRRYSLHFMLIENDPGYVASLKSLAHKIAPGRVTFHPPVTPDEIIGCLAEFDMGFYLLEPSSYNNEVALPNKFFDFIAAGLAICIGPSPSMAEMIRRYGMGCIAPDFAPPNVAAMLNQLTSDQLYKMRQASQKAARQLNADTEMAKVIHIYNRLLGEGGQ